MNQHEELRQFLLGQLPQPARDALEDRLFEDADLLEQIEATESELMAQYTAGALNRSERTAWERYLNAHPHSATRLQQERTLQHRFAPPPSPARTWAWWLIPATALLILFAVLIPRNTPTLPPTPLVLAITLQPGALRSATDRPQFLTIPAGIDQLRLTLPTPGAVRVRIRFVDSGATIFDGPLLNNDAVLPAQLLQPGDHLATVSSQTGEELADYTFRVQRTP